MKKIISFVFLITLFACSPSTQFGAGVNITFDPRQASDLIEELVDYKFQLNKVPSLNEQIGLNNFFYKIKNLFT